MPNIIQHKRSSTSGVVPAATGLSQGELAINIANGKLYTKNNSNSVINLGVTSISGTYITPASGLFSHNVTASGFVRSGGTSSQFLKADGSVDSSSYQTSLTNPITGTGTNGKLPKWNSTSTLNDSILSESSTVINIAGSFNSTIDDTYLSFDANARRIGITKKGGFTGKFTYGSTSSFAIAQSSSGTIEAANTFTDRFVINSNGNVGIGTSSPSYKLDIAGDAEFGSNNWLKLIDTGSNNGRLVFSNIGSIDSAGTFLFRNNAGTTEHMRITTGGDVGIGTTSPTSKLHVAGDILATGSFIAGSGSAGNPSFEFVGDTDTGMFAPAANTIALATSGVERLRISNIGRVGIGTLSPEYNLQVNGTQEVFAVIGNDLTAGGQPPTINLKGYTWFGKADGTIGIGAHHTPSTTFGTAGDIYLFEGFDENVTAYNSICLAAGFDPQLFLDTNLNVGIGTATPSEKLDVAGNININGSIRHTVNASDISDNIAPITWYNTYNDVNSVIAQIDVSTDSSPIEGMLVFHTNDGSSLQERLRITDVGNVGIGTATPSTKLDVNGNVNIDGNLTFDSFTESVVAIGSSSTSKTISLTSGTVQTCTLTGNCTFTMPTATAGKSFSLFLNTGSGGFTASFTGVRWSDSTPPTITSTASKVDLLSFISDGSFWYGSFSQNYG